MTFLRSLQAMLQTFFTFFSFPKYHINGLDIIIVIVLLFYAFEGYALGLVISVLDLISFLLAFVFALKGYGLIGGFLSGVMHMPLGFANALGFFLVAFVSEVILNIILRKLAKHFQLFSLFAARPDDRSFIRQMNHPLGIIPGLASAFIILTFLFSVMLSFPTSPFFKDLITNSRLGGYLVGTSSHFEKGLNSVFGGAINETLNFLTVEPKSDESIQLNFTVSSPQIDSLAETQMFVMLNHERTSRGLKPLVLDSRLRDLGRLYAKDMLQRGYFSHFNPEGKSPFDRMDNAYIQFTAAGENLALAPSTDLAMQGLMQSPGHRANMLNTGFGHVGIGVMDGGIYGKMYVQEFTN